MQDEDEEYAAILRPLPAGVLWMLSQRDDSEGEHAAWECLGVFSSPENALWALEHVHGIPEDFTLDDIYWYQIWPNPVVLEAYLCLPKTYDVRRWELMPVVVDEDYCGGENNPVVLTLHTKREVEARWAAEEATDNE